ncbi:MAG: ABC transporter substrate-binding protein, partial [Dehalococcoidia bacterium]
VVIKTSAPYASLVANLGHTWSVIVPPELGETPDIEQRSVGTGPFIFDEWRRGVELRWTKNPDYWKSGHPFADGIVQRIIPDAATRLANFRTGETLSWGGSYSATPKEQIDAVVASSEGAQIQEYFASGGVVKIAFDTTGEPFKDDRLRKAVKYAINYDQVIALFGGLASRTRGPFSEVNTEWAPPEDIVPLYDPDEAAKLLSAAGYGPDSPLKTLTQQSQFYSGPTVAQVAQGLLKPFGIDVEIEIMENARFVTEVYRGGSAFQMSSHGDWAWEDPDRGLYSYYHSQGTANNFHYSNPEVDTMLDAQRGQFDHEERYQSVTDIVTQLTEDTPQVWIVSTGGVSIQSPRFKNWKLMLSGNSNSYRQYGDVWLDS